ncbi:MAG: LicD family protein [Clostridium sp.]|nr:LicD family protein [Clostridium sp.]
MNTISINESKSKVSEENLAKAKKIMVEILEEVDRICTKYGIEYYLSDGTLLGAIRHGGFIPWDDDLDISMLRKDYNKFLEVAEKELDKRYFLQTAKTDKYYDIEHVPTKVRHNGSRFIEEDNKKYHQGVYIDIFPMDNVPNSNFKFKLQSKISSFIMKSSMRMRVKEEKLPLKNELTHLVYRFVLFIFKGKRREMLNNWLISLGDENSSEIIYGIDTCWDVTFNRKDIFPLQRIKFEDKYFLAPNNPGAILTKMYGDYMKLPPVGERTWHAKEIIIEE